MMGFRQLLIVSPKHLKLAINYKQLVEERSDGVRANDSRRSI
jgi:hypothetical protein